MADILAAGGRVDHCRLTASHAVLTHAELVLRRMTKQYYGRNPLLQELRALTLREPADPLKSFGKACRVGLKSMRAAV